MSDPTLLVLASLADGDKHGYAMMVDIREFAGGGSRPGDALWRHHPPGTPGIHQRPPSSDRRRPYRLTAAGRAHLEEQIAALEAGGTDQHAAAETGMNWIARLALQLYPAWWRRRYGTELQAMVEDSGPTWWTVLDIGKEATGHANP